MISVIDKVQFDVLECSMLLKSAQSLLLSSSTRRAVGWGRFLVLYFCCSDLGLFVLTRY